VPDDPNQPQLPGMGRPRRQAPPAWAPSSQPRVPFERRPTGSEKKIWSAAVPEAARPVTPRVMIQRLFGRTPRGRPDTKAAADQLGVSQRTVQRWIHDRKPPKSDAGQQLQSSYQQWQNTAAGRKSALGRKADARVRGTRRITFTGWLKISHDVRERKNMQIDIRAQHRPLVDNLVDQLAAGNDQAAHEALEDLVTNTADWGGDVYLRIDSLKFE
jgi:hypothetical protein